MSKPQNEERNRDEMPTERNGEPTEYAYSEDPCAMCGGPLFVLGKLGNYTHYRCEACGWTQ